MKKPNLGQKQTCKKCEARFFDLNKNPTVCPKCGEAFKITKSKTKRASAPAAEVVATETPVAAVDPVAAVAPEQVAEGDNPVDDDDDDDLEAVLEEDTDDDDLMEDTSDIGEDTDDMSEVLEHVDDAVGDK